MGAYDDYGLSEDEIYEGLVPVMGKYAIDADDGIYPVLADAFAAGFAAGADRVQREWDLAEELHAETRAGWDG